MSIKKIHFNSNPRVAIYVRVSTLHQIDKDSLPMQKQDLLAYAKLMLGTDDCVIFEDAGYSGKNTSRPKFQEMMSQIREGAFTHLLVWKIDRISRNLLDFATMYNELKNLGVTFVSKNEQFDTSTAMGEAMLKIVLVFAELERNMTAERVTATMISRASNGQWNGGRIPFGYNYDYETGIFTINQKESEIVKFIHDQYEKLHSLICIARELNNAAKYTRSGNEWSATTITIILHNVFYCGDYRYNVLKEGNRQKVKSQDEWITVKNHHEAIISHEQKEKVLAILESNKKVWKDNKTHHTTKHIHIFGGILFCGHCNKRMSCSPASKTKYGDNCTRYTCPSKRKGNVFCNNPSIIDFTVGEFIFNYILNMLNAQRNFTSISSPIELQNQLLIGDIFKHIVYIEADGLNDLYNVLQSGKITKEIYSKELKIKEPVLVDSELSKLRNEKQHLERALDRLTNLYLYSEEGISEREYIVQKLKLTNSIAEIDEQIGFTSSDEWQQSISDEAFIQRASEFILTQKLTNRNYINYKRLATSVDAEVLKSFVQSIINSIIIDTGKVKQIIFKNGLIHSFIYNSEL